MKQLRDREIRVIREKLILCYVYLDSISLTGRNLAKFENKLLKTFDIVFMLYVIVLLSIPLLETTVFLGMP